MGKQLFLGIALFMAVSLNGAMAAYDVARYCQLVETGTKLPSLDNCQTYYTCLANGGYQEDNCLSSQAFNKNTQSCQAASMVGCTAGAANPCENKNDGWVQDPSNCVNWIYCSKQQQSGRGSCPVGQYFSNDKGQCIWGQCTNMDDTNGELTEVANLCELMANNKYFGDFEECNAWHMCIDGTMKSGTCNGNLVYNTARGMCLKNDGTMCKRVGSNATPPSEPCKEADEGNYKGDTKVCSVYYQCKSEVWTKLNCPTGNYFDTITNTCVARQQAVATEGCDRCQFATVTWVNQVDPTCQNYFTCNSNGQEIAEGACKEGYYFNEQSQVCLYDDTLSTYRKNNGACYLSDVTTSAPTTPNAPTDAPTEVPNPAPTDEPAGAPAPTDEPAGAPAPTDEPAGAPAPTSEE